jgi:RNase P/RNase MRP subunit p29
MEGLVLKETQQTFQILTQNDELKTILKKGIVFLLRVPTGELVQVFGDAVTFRAFDRSKMKFREYKDLEFFKI